MPLSAPDGRPARRARRRVARERGPAARTERRRGGARRTRDVVGDLRRGHGAGIQGRRSDPVGVGGDVIRYRDVGGGTFGLRGEGRLGGLRFGQGAGGTGDRGSVGGHGRRARWRGGDRRGGRGAGDGGAVAGAAATAGAAGRAGGGRGRFWSAIRIRRRWFHSPIRHPRNAVTTTRTTKVRTLYGNTWTIARSLESPTRFTWTVTELAP